MSSLQELAALGEKIGLEKEDLKEFIKEQQAAARAEREREREERDRDRQMELQKEREQRQIELEKEREHTKQLELKIKLGESRSQVTSDTDGEHDDASVRSVTTARCKIKGPKMSAFDERDDMDSYLHRFERYADLQGWKKNVWAVYLSALLKGKALDVYARLPPDQSQDYDVLKAALLRRYALTEEGYKNKFYECKPEKGESPQQFIIRLDSYFLRWLELAEVERSFDGIRSLMVRERYLATCSKSLELFLRERAVTELEELAKLAEQYEDAHGRKSTDRRESSPVMPTSASKNAIGSSKASVGDTVPKRKCFVCGKSGHIAKNCFQKVKTGAMMPTVRVTKSNGQRQYRSSGGDQRQNTVDSNVSDRKNVGSRDMELNRAIYCKLHGRSYCQECCSSTPPTKHTCNALLGPELELKCGCTIPILAEACDMMTEHKSMMPVTKGTLFGNDVNVLRDTGCSTVVVKRSLVPDVKLTGRTVVCVLIDGTARRTPTAMIDIETPHLSGTVEAVCMKQPMYDLIVGNVPGVLDESIQKVTDFSETEYTCKTEAETSQAQAVMTRSQAQKSHNNKPLNVTESVDCGTSVEEMTQLQKEDKTLTAWWEKANQKPTENEREFGTIYVVKDCLLWRKREDQGRQVTQLAVPEPLRDRVLRLAHDCIMSGHQGVKKTYERVTAHFFWPGVHGDVVRYCRSCDVCQRTSAKGRVSKTPLGKMPLIEMPFKRVAVDLIGPIAPVTERGNRYILTMVDYATRYPEAAALKNIETETVAEALVTLFTRVGVPEEILSDQGSQFMSGIMKEISRLLSLTQLVTTPYHPMCNGLVERFNGTLKAMLKRMCSERPKDWDRYLPALLFAYREVPQESLGFAPFELLYGRTIRGPMAILKEIWTKQKAEPDVKLTYQYVLELQERLQETCEMAREELGKAQKKQKRYFDVKSRSRTFSSGDKVLLLLPSDNNKLLMQWKGPYEVIERRNDNNYRIQLPGSAKLFHANMLKRYTERNACAESDVEVLGAAVIDIRNEEEVDFAEFSGKQQETFKDVNINPELPPEKRQEIENLLSEFQDVFSDVPKVTGLGEHRINLTSSDPIRSKPYPLPYAMREAVDREIDCMLELGIIEPSTAPYSSPIVVVKKSDGSNRICVDYRKLNNVTVFDPEPLPQIQEIFSDLSGSQYFSKFDFCKGYWQVPMSAEDRDLTTFVTHRGLFRFRVMPFGLVNAPATFSRIMRKLLDKLQKLRNYLDDVLAHTAGWSQHISTLRQFLERVREANLALKPSKCFVGYNELTFLGHKLGQQGVSPTVEMIEKITRAPAPTTKKQLRSFLGLVGYYRSFVPNFAAIAVPLTDLTKKGSSNQLQWNDVHEHAFRSLKGYVCNPPVLKLPDMSLPFILQTDASCDGLGAILLQQSDDIKHPVAFASKKLLPRERNYSTIEREALAIVWGVQKFQHYLLGTHFLLETDHHPLQYLHQAKFQNSRVMRWSLILQPYRFTVRAIKGSQNVGADFLSRHAC